MSATEASPAREVISAPQTETPTVLDIWQKFDLNGRRTELDKQGLDIADRKERSLASRKHLTSDTRTFRNSLSDANLVPKKDFINLLKSYQTEVDALTTRARTAETVFLSLYKDLYDAPDPVEELSKAVSDAQESIRVQNENEALREERGSLSERTAVTNKYEKKITELESEMVTMKSRITEETSVIIEKKQTQWMAAQQKTMEAYDLREQELLHQLHLANEQSRRLQNSSDELERQVNDATSQLEVLKSSHVSVNEMAVEDFERTLAEAKGLRTRCNELETILANREKGVVDFEGTTVSRSALSAELAAKDVEISQLQDRAATLEEVLGGKDQEKSKQYSKLTSAIQHKDDELGSLREQLEKFPSFEEYQTLVRQFETLQSFQLSETEKNMEASLSATDEVMGESKTGKSDSLEKKLLTKVKNLEGKVTRMRVELGDKDSRITELKTLARSNEDQITDQKSLISKLEGSISAMTGEHKSSTRRAANRSASAADFLSQADAGNEEERMEEEFLWDWGERQQAQNLSTIIREEPSMLDIVAGQRDRFRARTMELEEENRKLMERIEKLASDMDSLKGDNVSLYEKIRFLQSYQRSGGNLGGSSDTPGNDSRQTAGEDEDSRSFLGKYRSMYEDLVNPYTIFNRRERHKRMSEMSAAERLTLRASQRALSTKTSRLILFFYIISLHVLVALVLGFSTGCDHNIRTKAQH